MLYYVCFIWPKYRFNLFEIPLLLCLILQVVQVTAYELGVDMKYIQVQPPMTITNANARGTYGSITSELVCLVL